MAADKTIKVVDNGCLQCKAELEKPEVLGSAGLPGCEAESTVDIIDRLEWDKRYTSGHVPVTLEEAIQEITKLREQVERLCR
jgi:hypothetical protein